MLCINKAIIITKRKTVWKYLRKLNIELPYGLAIPLLGIYLDKTTIPKDACTRVFTGALFTLHQTKLSGNKKKMYIFFS